jgi:hypothetical protein
MPERVAMDGELDGGIGIRRMLHRERFAPPRAAFDQHVEVNRTALISAKAVVERVAESCQTHVLTAARVATIQKRAMIRTSTRSHEIIIGGCR